MKKLIAMVAFVAATITANAAAITWSALSVGASPTTPVAAGAYTAYFFAVSDTSKTLTTVAMDDVIASIAAGNAADVIGSAAFSKKNTGTSSSTFNSSGNGSFAAGTTVEGFVVILDAATASEASYYMVAAKNSNNLLSATAADSGNMSFAFGSQASNTWNEIQSVPEPTSALMLLVGLAGLALKRKVA